MKRRRSPVANLGLVDQLRVASSGMRSHKLRAALSGLGIAIGIGSLVAVLGLSASSRADLDNQLDALGTNLLTVTAGQSLLSDATTLPEEAPARIRHLVAVQNSSTSSNVTATVRRTSKIPKTQTSGIRTQATTLDLLQTLRGKIRSGKWLDPISERLPAVVLGATAAERLGISDLSEPIRIWLGDQWFAVAGILQPLTLAPALDEAALIGVPIATAKFAPKLRPDTIYVRVDPTQLEQTRAVLGRTANPIAPEETSISRPSDALRAAAAAKGSFKALYVALGAVALLVGAVGIANVMVIAVLERRNEIGLRRALGATRRNITVQFLMEAVLLATGGALAGCALGGTITLLYALSRSWQPIVPPNALLIGTISGLITGAVAGLYPAVKASRLAPIEALRST